MPTWGGWGEGWVVRWGPSLPPAHGPGDAWQHRGMSAAPTIVRPMLEAVADPGRAPAMAAYMKQVAPYLGVSAPQRRAATKAWLRGVDPGPGAGLLLADARALVAEPEREFAYVAIDLVARHLRALPATALPDLRGLALTVPWWDTVDAWSSVIGRASARHGWDAEVASWAVDPALWARRVALVFQVGRREAVDLALVFGACRATMDDRDFFMRKGIGWALRDAARTYPEEVRAFVEAHRDRLSGLSVREATKHL